MAGKLVYLSLSYGFLKRIYQSYVITMFHQCCHCHMSKPGFFLTCSYYRDYFGHKCFFNLIKIKETKNKGSQIHYCPTIHTSVPVYVTKTIVYNRHKPEAAHWDTP